MQKAQINVLMISDLGFLLVVYRVTKGGGGEASMAVIGLKSKGINPALLSTSIVLFRADTKLHCLKVHVLSLTCAILVHYRHCHDDLG